MIGVKTLEAPIDLTWTVKRVILHRMGRIGYPTNKTLLRAIIENILLQRAVNRRVI